MRVTLPVDIPGNTVQNGVTWYVRTWIGFLIYLVSLIN